jgi:3-oxoisoapionate decarboxylase
MRIVVGHRDLVRHPAGDGDVEAAMPAVARLAELAESVGVVLALENHADLRAAQLAKLIDSIGSPRLGVCFDTANAVRVGDDVLAAAAMLAQRIVMAHVKDVGSHGWRDRFGPTSVPLGSGSLPVRRVVDMLRPTAGIDLWLLVELGHLGARDIDERTLVRAELCRLREWTAGCE